jgi:hypothetical protein
MGTSKSHTPLKTPDLIKRVGTSLSFKPITPYIRLHKALTAYVKLETMKKACKSLGSLLSRRARSLDNAHRPSAIRSGKGMANSRCDCGLIQLNGTMKILRIRQPIL